MTTPTTGALSATRTVGLVAAREMRTRMRSKAFVISNAVFLVLIVGGVVVTALLTGGSDEPAKIGLVGDARSLSGSLSASGDALGTPVKAVPVADEASARARVSAGDVEVAVLAGSGGEYTAITDKEVSAELRTVLDTAVRQQALDGALRARGVDPAELTAATAGAMVTVDALNPSEPNSKQRTALAYISVLLLYVQLLANGIAVASGVVEEKTSRVVELLLSTIKPLHLLTGKIVGIGIVGLVTLTAYGAAGLAAGVGTGLITITGTAVAVLAGTLGWFVLGYAFFAALYAAAGSLVSRQEEVGSATAPLTLLVLAMFFLAQAAVQDPSGTLSTVASWIPPFSAILMPLRIAAGVTSPVQVIGTVLLMGVATSVLAVVAAKVYQRSVLHTGTKVTWKQALGRA